MATKIYQKRDLAHLLNNSSARKISELEDLIDEELILEAEAASDIAAHNVSGAAHTALFAGKAAKTTAAATADSVVTAVASAPVQTAAYVQADVQAIADLANDLKAKYDAAVALINELKAKINTMNA